MGAVEYYRGNAQRNPRGRPDGDARSEIAYARRWLTSEGIRGALLDVGCGPLNLLLTVDGFHNRVGIDIAAHDEWHRHPEISTVVANIDSGGIPFEDGSFDAVTCLMVLEHLFDPFNATAEIRRVMKPSGRAIVAVPNIAGIKRRLELLIGQQPITSTRASFDDGAWDGYHLHYFTKRSLTWLLLKAGLTPVRWTAHGRAPFLKKLRPSLFGDDLIVMCVRSNPTPMLRFEA